MINLNFGRNSRGDNNSDNPQYIDTSHLRPARDADTQAFRASRRAAARNIRNMNGGRVRSDDD